ncbi:glutamate receptor ionotropic, kainate glr-3-like [Haliotis asinina]|uniref:glutamate receptor ionotropic, kainate glr-3-like n=1 Tax=Haliotis asinina TaxID=109174 RepID=UPI0035324CF5
MLMELLLSLTWKSVLVLHENQHDLYANFSCSLKVSSMYCVDYDISSSSKGHLNRMLKDVGKVLQPHLNVLLLCDVTTTVSVLRQMSRFCGTRSNSSVDLCHVARVLVVGTSDDLPVLQESSIQVENVALVERSTTQGNGTKTRIWTLMFHQTGRFFTDVPFCSGAVTNPTDVFPNIKSGYNGRQLTVVMKENHLGYGFVTVNKRRVFAYPFHLMNLLSQAMNFSYRVIPPREDEWGRNINGSWTGVFGMLQRREADLAADTLAMHSDRLAVSDNILPSVGVSGPIILYKKEDAVEEDNLLICLRPFQTFVYSMFGLSLIAYVSLVSFVRLIHNKDLFIPHVGAEGKDTDRNMDSDNNCSTATRVIQTTTAAAFAIYGAAVKQGSTITSSSDSERILVAGWWMFTTIFSAVYCGTIMAIFAVKSEKPPFSNMAELAAREDYKIGYDASSIIGNLFQNTGRSDVMAIKQRVQELSSRDPDVITSNMTKHLQNVRGGKYAFIASKQLAVLVSADCRLTAIDAKLIRGLSAFHLPRQSPFRQEFQER